MSTELQNMKRTEITLFLRIVDKLYRSHHRDQLRHEIAEDLLRLLKADFLASYIWNEERRVFEHAVFLNMTPENLDRYHTYYQFHDPITPSLQQRRRATLVREVMPQKELERTEFFNDFLMKDGLHHGINVYAYDGDLNIGDLRIWRAQHRPDFGKRESALLDLILPYFQNALRNMRAISAAQGMANFWRQLLDNTRIALFLFDEKGSLVYRNSNAKLIEEDLSGAAYINFYDYVCSAPTLKSCQTQWGPFSVSVLHMFSPEDSRPVTAVMVYRSRLEKLDGEVVRTKYRLTPREIEICLLVCKGLTDQEIASALGITFYTVRTHLKHIFSKLDATTRSELIYHLLEGIVEISF
ncbi:MAG: helix-turn-helix transcriptional regulator [Thermodesulfobacteriota bacterium]